MSLYPSGFSWGVDSLSVLRNKRVIIRIGPYPVMGKAGEVKVSEAYLTDQNGVTDNLNIKGTQPPKGAHKGVVHQGVCGKP